MVALCGTNCVGCFALSWLSLLAFFLTEAWINLRRHGVATFATVFTVALVVGLWGAFALLVKGAQRWLLWEGAKLERLCVFLKPQADEQVAYRLQKRLRRLPQVIAVRFVHREEGLRRIQQLFGDTVPLKDLIGHNPLPHALEVTLQSPQAVARCAAILKKMPEVDEVAYPAAAVERFVQLLGQVRRGANVFSLLLAIAAFALIHNAIRLSLYGRRNEIRIMQLVGATVWTVRGPFIAEGFLYGVFGGLMALAILGGLRWLGLQTLEAGYLRGALEAMVMDADFVQQALALAVALGTVSATVAALQLVKPQ
ncbi:MAG: hypothetical protein HZLCBSQH_001599 [Candidatus Fervidibacterota bacterium]